MRGSPATMSSVPLPWCTSKSTMATRCRPWRSSAYLAAIATLLKKQKPMALSWQAWWPGGRTQQKAFSSSPAITASVAAMAAPAERRAASQVWMLIEVSGSILAWVGPPASISSRSPSLRPAQGGDEHAAMGQFDVGQRRHRRLAPVQCVPDTGDQQAVFDGVQALGAFGVAGTHFMLAAVSRGKSNRFCSWRVGGSSVFG